MLSNSLRHCIVLFFVNIDTNIAEICFRHPDFVTGSPTDCHRFYNCSEESSFFHQMSSGYMPSCKGVANGTFLTTSVRCDVFYPCFNGTTYALRCAKGLVFDVSLGTCVLETTTCTTVR